ncbi:MAG: helix-turn-helix transcriptional regulator [Promethearchaeota archaeon]
MWLSKFLDLKEDLETLPPEIRNKILHTIKKKKLTPLEFTILEYIIKYPNGISGYDLIDALNEHFAGTWEAQSGTIYPLLSKLKHDGFLMAKNVKSPIGPIKKVYSLTEVGKTIIETKINVKFVEQIKFTENFIKELLSVYIDTIQEEEKEDRISEIYKLIEEMFNRIFERLIQGNGFKKVCPKCNTEIHRRGSVYCFYCGADLRNNNE